MPQTDYFPFDKTKAVDVDFTGESSMLQKQVGDMEGVVKEMQLQLAAMKKNRLKNSKETVTEESKDAAFEHCVYVRQDKENTYEEIGKLRAELIRAKNVADEERFQRERYKEKLKDLEQKLNNICSAGTMTEFKESRKIINEETVSMKTQIRDMQEEMEEMRATITDKTEQLQDYRVKYLQAQQQVEELKRQLDLVEFDNKQVTDQIQIEIQKMKMQFQEKLQDLSPLPDLLKGSQIQLQEAKQLQKLAEDNSRQLSSELHKVKEKLMVAVNNLNQDKVEKSKLAETNIVLRTNLDEKQKETESLAKSLDEYKCQVMRLEEKLNQLEYRYKEKMVECAQLLKDLDAARAEATRSLTRAKERSESMRRYLQTQISEMERQLIQSRAQCRACQKERDEIRQKMQIQINNLQENFELGEIRLRTLQNQVATLKNSYTAILGDEEGDFNKITATQQLV